MHVISVSSFRNNLSLYGTRVEEYLSLLFQYSLLIYNPLDRSSSPVSGIKTKYEDNLQEVMSTIIKLEGLSIKLNTLLVPLFWF